MNTARKIAASGTIGLGLAMVSFALPGIANAADSDIAAVEAAGEVPAQAQASGLPIPSAALDDDDDETTPTPTPSPTLPTMTIPTPSPTTPTPTPGDPTAAPTTPSPTSPTRPPTPGDGVDPGTPGTVEEDDDSTPGDDTGESDPGSGDSGSQSGDLGSNIDPVLGTGVAPQGLQRDATPPTDSPQAKLPAAGSPGQLPVLVLGLGLIVVGGVLVKRPYAARHRV
ncbi:hypothetical protein [Aeromicrobium chenweiae]|uniref:LPXTG cell wall anchor domain-containing protein n=1 Tax=Aeromicrobium chenweiae TaxID=2079793 RepID=A0A2S0WQH2_9ACTN|nr:hypothetical protein [Aeromicrobium chenweiae]AWB93613.1 hypothetical protein C3E78_16120 [Aeromicrobium chenweiae]